MAKTNTNDPGRPQILTTQRPPAFGPLVDAADAARALGLAEEDLLPPGPGCYEGVEHVGRCRTKRQPFQVPGMHCFDSTN